MLDPRRWALVWIIGFALISIGYLIGSSKVERDFTLKVNSDRAIAAEKAVARLTSATASLITAQTQYSKEVKDGQAALSDAIRNVHTGSSRLSISVKPRSCSPTPGSTEGSNGTERAELSTQSAEFLVREANRADEVVKQLKLAQETVRQLQKACKQ